MPPEHAGCATFYMIRSADGPVQPLGVPELAAGVDCGLLPQGPTLASLEQVRPLPMRVLPPHQVMRAMQVLPEHTGISLQHLDCLPACHGGWQAADWL